MSHNIAATSCCATAFERHERIQRQRVDAFLAIARHRRRRPWRARSPSRT